MPAAMLTVVFHENRLQEGVGVKLLARSLRRHAPTVHVCAYLSPELSQRLEGPLQRIHPQAEVRRFVGPSSWAVKPFVLLDALERVHPEQRVLWVDTDVLVTNTLSSLESLDPSWIATAEEANPSAPERVGVHQRMLGVAEGTARESTISSAVIGVTAHHREAVTWWRDLLTGEAFRREQTLPTIQRALFGDQEVWEAVLCSPRFRSVPVMLLRNWHEMLQPTYSSPPPFSLDEGYRALFVHATGNLKPWRTSRFRLLQEMFPYFDEAQRYIEALDEEERQAFLSRSPTSRAWKKWFGAFSTYLWARRTLRRVLPAMERRLQHRLTGQ